MAEKKQHFTARISESLVKKINEEAKSRDTTVTAIVEEAFNRYFYGSVPGLCPSCHTQNDPDAQYCQKCGASLTEEAKEKQMRLEEMMRDPETLKELLKRALEHLEEIGYTKKE